MMKKTAYIAALLFAVAFAAFGEGVDAVEAPVSAADTTGNAANAPLDRVGTPSSVRRAFVIPVSGAVDYGMAAFVGRAVHEAAAHDDALIILDIDTFGGAVDAAFTIADSIAASRVPTVAFVRSKAISAGALIALSADQLFMRPNSTIGDVAPLINTNEGPKMLGEKHQSPIRAKFRTLARKNGYPEALTEAMVTESIEVFEIVLPDTVKYLDSLRVANLDDDVKGQIVSQKLIVKAGELLTMTETEALRYGFSRKTVNSIDEMLRAMGHTEAEVVHIRKNWSEGLVSIIAMLAPVLMMLGFAMLYIEMRSPGFGIPGAVGVVCLALVFFGQHMVGLAGYTELLLIMLGVTLLCVEIFVLPGFFIGAVGIGVIVIGMLLSFQSFVIPSPELPWQAAALKVNVLRVSLSILGSIVLTLVFFRYFFERLGRVVKGPYLSATLEGAQSDADMAFVPKIGDSGVATTPLRPAGKVSIDKNLCDVVTEGQFIDAGMTVVVSQIQGNRIVVTVE
jgi:membrane-bound serine protease (ClpP class)